MKVQEVVAATKNSETWISEKSHARVTEHTSLNNRQVCIAFAKSSDERVSSLVEEYCFQSNISRSELQRQGSRTNAIELCGAMEMGGLTEAAKSVLLAEENGRSPKEPAPAPKAPAPAPKAPAPEFGDDDAAKLKLLNDMFGSKADITPERVAEIAADIKKQILAEFGPNGGKPTRIIVETIDRDGKKKEGEPQLEHAAFPLVMAAVRAGVNIALPGPAGSGKTTMASNIAKALCRSFYSVPCNPGTMKGDVIGRGDPMSKEFFDGVMVTAMRVGGVLLLDEFDKLNAQIAAMTNAALANRSVMTQSGERIDASPNTVFMAAMNTFGTGATDLYASNRMSAETLDRMFFIDIQYDPALEAAMCGCDVRVKSPDYSVGRGGSLKSREAWFNYVQAVRGVIADKGISHVVSPRATAMGIALAEHGVGLHWLKEGLVFKGLKPAQRKLIEDGTKSLVIS